ncbi:MAG: hypothetical protein K2W96_27730, partial [Gemmataceae bacterium]|nr:hypothetical protein [Gemmataceae bacterium]
CNQGRRESVRLSRMPVWVVPMLALKRLFMEKWMCYGSMGVAGLLALLFLLDLFVSFPFGRASLIVDVFGLIASGLVLFLAYDAFKDIR